MFPDIASCVLNLNNIVAEICCVSFGSLDSGTGPESEGYVCACCIISSRGKEG